MIIAGVSAALLVAAAGHKAAIPPDLARAVREYDDAQVRGDRIALNKLLADDYLLINSRGLHESKTQLIADYTAPGFTLKPFKVEDAIVKVWSGSAIIGGVATLEGTDSGQPYKVRLRFADVWAKRAGHWKVLYTQASRESPQR